MKTKLLTLEDAYDVLEDHLATVVSPDGQRIERNAKGVLCRYSIATGRWMAYDITSDMLSGKIFVQILT